MADALEAHAETPMRQHCRGVIVSLLGIHWAPRSGVAPPMCVGMTGTGMQ